MSWRDDLRRVKMADGRTLIAASFRGVPFFVESSTRAGGRRAVDHEFPYRAKPFVEDLGQKAKVYRLDGYVLGDDYVRQRDKLLDACELEEGPGQLVSPYDGVVTAICVNCEVRESKSEGGIAMFALEFHDAPLQAPVPTEVVDGADQVSLSADAADAATDAELAEKFDPAGLPLFALESAVAAISKATAAVQAKLSLVVKLTDEAAKLNAQATIIVASAASLVATPADIMGSFRSMFSALADTIESGPEAVMEALIDSYGEDLGTVVDAITATRERELENQTALTSALRRGMAIEAARIAPLVAYESIESAMAARDAIAAMLDEQAELATDTAYPAIVDLRAQVMRAVPGSAELARVVTVERRSPVPSILLAYQLYGSTDLEADVIARNGVSNPGFIAGTLKVLSDG